jgi:adenosine deaminase
LGHGIRAYEDKKLLEVLRKNKITLECCPISNMNTQVFRDFSIYPLKNYIDSGIKATINTDNRTVSDTNYQKEINFLDRYTPLTLEEIYLANKNAIKGAFISKEEKKELLKKLNEN